jgi:tyrosine-protein kinase Etk/Wzc
MMAVPSSNLWSFLELLARRKRLILSVIVLVTVLAVVVSLVLPRWYTATALLLPPKNISVPVNDVNNWSEALSLTSGLNLPMRATPSDVYVRMLKSRAVASRVIDSFDLIARYGTGTFEETYQALMDHADIRVSEEGLLTVAVEDWEPKVAADIANAFVAELEIVSASIVADRIGKTRRFLTGRLEQVKAEVDSSRAALQEFQMKYRAVDFDEQTRLAIEQAIALKVKLAEVEYETHLSALTLGRDNVEMIKLNRRQNIIKNQLRQLENENADSSFFSLPVSDIPSLKGQFEVLYSRVEVAEALYQVLLEQSEQAKVKEYENLPSISVLDAARQPTLHSRPRRGLIVGLAFGLSVIFAVILAAGVEYVSRLKHTSPEDYGRLMLFVDAFVGWLPGVRRPSEASRTDVTVRDKGGL